MASLQEKQLYEIAEKQLGYFTTKQAISAGYLAKNHTYHVKQGGWIREYRGVYRLAHFPHTQEGERVLWSLWSRNRKEFIQAVYSHETALSFYEVSDAMPAKLHMTIPTTFRKTADIPNVLILHRADLPLKDILTKNGYSVTTPFRTIKDLVAQESTDETILDQAIKEFRTRGLLTEKQMLRLVENHPSLAKHLLGSRVIERRL